VLVVADGSLLIPEPRTRMWLRLRARFAAGKLDRQLAEGAEPETSGILFAHASRIASPSACASLAASVRRVVAHSETTRCVSNRAPLSREEILSTRAEMLELADRLERPGPVGARGVAQIRVLLADGAGPLYRVGDGAFRLRTDLRAVLEHL
jgi:hypothetical protein